MWAVSENVRIHVVCFTVFVYGSVVRGSSWRWVMCVCGICIWKCSTWKDLTLGYMFVCKWMKRYDCVCYPSNTEMLTALLLKFTNEEAQPLITVWRFSNLMVWWQNNGNMIIWLYDQPAALKCIQNDQAAFSRWD